MGADPLTMAVNGLILSACILIVLAILFGSE